MHKATLPAISAALLATCHAGAQQTIRVPQDQPTIEAAIAAATNGDRIQLTQASYSIGANGLTLGKSLVVETVGSARATITYPDSGGATTPAFPALTITGFGGGSRIVLRNVTFDGGFSIWAGSAPRTAVVDVQLAAAVGELVLEGVEAIGEARHQHDACPGLRVASGKGVRVLLRHSRFEGATGQSPLSGGGNDVEYDGSAGAIVAAQGPFVAEACHFVGGAGGRASWSGPGPFSRGRDGGAAIECDAVPGSIKACELFEGDPGAVFVSNAVGAPNACQMYGATGASTVSADVYDCVRSFLPPGCSQTPQTVSMNPGRSDADPIPPVSVGVPFSISIRPLPPASGLTFWIFGTGLESLAVPGVLGRLYVENAILVGLVPPAGPTGWSQITFPAPPATLPWLPTFAVQALHLDNTLALQLGAVSTFTVLVP